MNLNDFIKKEGSIKDPLPLRDNEINTPKENITSKHNNSNSFINKKIVNDLLKSFKIEEIEAGLLKYFITKNKLTSKNRLINDILKFDSEGKAYHYFVRLNKNITLSDIERLFELLIPSEDKRINGAVYTPKYIVDYIVTNTIKKFGTVCDCSCGAGAFLLGSLKHLKEISNKPIIEIIESCIYGADINSLSVRRAKIILTLYAILNNEDSEEIKFNIRNIDSLETDWNNVFPNIKSQGGFDFVVGNPPYVRIQDLDDVNKDKLLSKWSTIKSGNFNLYFAFFELGMEILNNKGVLGYITPNNYFTSLAGVQLREWFSKHKQINRILNFNHLKIFDNAQTYTCITFMNKDNHNEYFEYYYLEDKSLLQNLDSVKFSRYFYEWLDSKKWRLMSEGDYHNIRKIETSGKPLGKVCQIRVGIATLKDNIFFVEDLEDENLCKATYNNKNYFIEKSITRKVVKISSMKEESEIEKNNRRIIFPYKNENDKFIAFSEEELKNNYPKCYSYLLDAKKELETRDKGKKSYPVWFAWGRTQGMNYRGKRLYTRTFYHKPDFMFDETEDSFFCNGYAVFCKNRVKAIQKLLNSEVMNYYVKMTSVEIEGNYQCYQKNFIEKFTILDFSEDEWKYIETEEDINKLNNWLFEKYQIKR